MEVDEGSDQKSDILTHWMAAYSHLKIEFMEDEKYHNLMIWLFYFYAKIISGWRLSQTW